jgi:enterochelin esterase-like enzyme
MPISGWQKIFNLLSGKRPTAPAALPVHRQTVLLDSEPLAREVVVDIYVAAPYTAGLYVPKTAQPPHLFIFNDGQDVRQMHIPDVLRQCQAQGLHQGILLVGVHANHDRMREYGTSHQTDYAGRGDKAPAHSQFITQELLPYLQRQYSLTLAPEHTTIAGFSLGGLSAFDIAWHHPHLFGRGGIFSGSLWWRAQAFHPDAPDAHRIVHTLVESAPTLPALRYWLQTGTLDETDDRNNNGVIDSIDDTLDLIQALKNRGTADQAIHYEEVEGGQHDPDTWARVMPAFLMWAARGGGAR